ncbi:MAG: type II toxin-antitoxin system RelE/ParE family toxin [Anaerolineales bacterium]|nr:type II toxin-antitoxin system RelE/ParE family toxin [Anaerolineales bacterium]
MTYAPPITRPAKKGLEDLPAEPYQRVKAVINELAQTPRPEGCKKLVERAGWRIRVGDYRVLYTIDDDHRIVTIVHVSKRSDAYR